MNGCRFGDVAPRSTMGRAFDMAMIVFAGVLIPVQISGYSSILSREVRSSRQPVSSRHTRKPIRPSLFVTQTAFDKKYIPEPGVQHVVLCGDIDHGSLYFFLHDWLYREREIGLRQQVVILAPTLPAPNLKRILIRREYEQRVIYLQGSAMVAADLQRASSSTADRCFVMVKKHSYSLDQNDTSANLITCSVRKNNKRGKEGHLVGRNWTCNSRVGGCQCLCMCRSPNLTTSTTFKYQERRPWCV